MAASQNVELEAAKFLHKLIQDNKDEPSKLATKLYVILQHMKSSGKEHSMPYQVISRAMETVINQHGLDIEALKASRAPLFGGTQTGDAATTQHAESSQIAGVAQDLKSGLVENEISKVDPLGLGRSSSGPSNATHTHHQGSGTQRTGQSFDHLSPSSFDTRSANSQSQERGETVNQKEGKKATAKRKRGDSSNDQMDHSPSVPANVRAGNTFNSMLRSMKYTDEVKLRSTNDSSGQGGSIPSTYDSSRDALYQNQAGLPFERSQAPMFSSNVVSGNMMREIPVQRSTSSITGQGTFGKFHGEVPLPSSYPEKSLDAHMFSANSGDEISTTLPTGKGGRQNANLEKSVIKSPASREIGTSAVSQAPATSSKPFKEQQLKQLRAQCLVFLAFRNNLPQKKLHLDLALENISPNDDGSCIEMVDNKGKPQSSNELSSFPEVSQSSGKLINARETERIPHNGLPTGRLQEHDFSTREAEKSKWEDSNCAPSNFSDERKHFLPSRKPDAEMQGQEVGELHGAGRSEHMSNISGTNRQVNSDSRSWTGISSHSDVSRGQTPFSAVQHELLPERRKYSPGHFHGLGNNTVSDNQLADGKHWEPVPGNNYHNVIPVKDVNLMMKHVSQDGSKLSEFQSRGIPGGCNVTPVKETLKNGTYCTTELGEEDAPVVSNLPHIPSYSTSEKLIMDQQKKKILSDQIWAQKKQRTDTKITVYFNKLKESVSSSGDISAKTKSVIDLKKLQLLELQRRLRSEFLNEFFKPVTTDMERLKSYKKHKHGRRVKQLEKYEAKMKEERQKRIRERQKEFFSEIEGHKERLEDVFKIRRERWKGLNRYVKEFHKRKERIHREKIDRIQREKINLLKINDVEGYLRMVQDAKSDRVKQLLKETEKYLQKLGSKLRDAKTIARRFENDMDETPIANVVEKTETTFENEDESDQAKHYMESNEKYYLMAHSVKENIIEQPTCLVGGKLREYQMNGLRWLLSLYNNHLNGILADEMGLGKTVQVIALICYLMETKNDRGPFLVVVPSSVLPGWVSEFNLWAPSAHKIVYTGTPEERRRLFKEQIVHQKFNVLLTTYEYLMNKHDRPKLSKVHWHYIIIDEGHRIKNASCKLNADLKHYQSSHRLLLTGTPLQNNLEELWALLNFLLPNIFNSSEDFSQWFNKPFQGNGDSSADDALLSEEENLLVINRLHQVLRPFVLRRLKHKVENELPEKIERLVRCEASAYQKLLMKRVEDNLGSIGNSKSRAVHNSVMELRNICNHPYLSQLHADEVDNLLPRHFLPPVIRLCGKLEMLDRLLPKLKATDHRVLFFSTMTRLLDVMEEYLNLKQYRYLRLDGHTSGGDRGALIDNFNRPDSPFFIFLLSIRAGGVGVNLQAADTVIIFDTDWNPQVDLQAQARAHRIGQKRDVLVLRFETVQTVEEQVRASAEHKLGVANQSITAGFFDNNTSAEDRREYLEALLRECKKEEAAPVLDDDALNDLLARSESEIDIFESIDKQRQEEEMATWKMLSEHGSGNSDLLPTFPSRLVTEDDLKMFCEAMKLYEVPTAGTVSNVGVKRKGEQVGGLDSQHYGRGKRAREVRSYEEQLTEEEFEKMCQADSPESPKLMEKVGLNNLPTDAGGSRVTVGRTEPLGSPDVSGPLVTVGSSESVAPPNATGSVAVLGNTEPLASPLPPSASHSVEQPPRQQIKEVAPPPPKRGRGRPRKVTPEITSAGALSPVPSGTAKGNPRATRAAVTQSPTTGVDFSNSKLNSEAMSHVNSGVSPSLHPVVPDSQYISTTNPVPLQAKTLGQNMPSGVQSPLHKGKRQDLLSHPKLLVSPGPNHYHQLQNKTISAAGNQAFSADGSASTVHVISGPNLVPGSTAVDSVSGAINRSGSGAIRSSQTISPLSSATSVSPSSITPVPPSSVAPVPPSSVAPVPPSSVAPVLPSSVAPVLPSSVAPVPPSSLAPVPPSSLAPVPPSSLAPVPPSSLAPVPPSSLAPVPPSSLAPVPPSSLAPVPPSSLAPVPPSSVTPVPPSSVTPVPNVPPSYVTPVLPSSVTAVPPSSVPLQIVQGRKTRNGGATPQRRGKKQTQVSVNVPLGQDSISNAQSHGNRVDSMGNKGIAVTSKPQNDALKQAQVTQKQYYGVQPPGFERPVTSSTYSSVSTLKGPAPGETKNVAGLTKEELPETTTSKAKSNGLSGNEGSSANVPVLSKNATQEVASQSKGDKMDTTSALKVATAVHLTRCLPNTAAEEGVLKPNTPAYPVYPSTAVASQAITSFSLESTQTKRQGRKTPRRSEAPRGRGRKQQRAAVSATPASQDLNHNLQAQNKSTVSLGSKAVCLQSKQENDAQERSTVVQVHSSEIPSPGGCANRDPKKREPSGIPAFGSNQTADVNNVARVMKEIFSASSISTTKSEEQSLVDGKSIPMVASSSKMGVEMVKNLTSEDKASSPSTSAAVTTVPKISNEEHKEQSAIGGDANVSSPIKVEICASEIYREKAESETHTVSESIASSRNNLVSASEESSLISSPSETPTVSENRVSSAKADGHSVGVDPTDVTTSVSGNKTPPLVKEPVPEDCHDARLASVSESDERDPTCSNTEAPSTAQGSLIKADSSKSLNEKHVSKHDLGSKEASSSEDQTPVQGQASLLKNPDSTSTETSKKGHTSTELQLGVDSAETDQTETGQGPPPDSEVLEDRKGSETDMDGKANTSEATSSLTKEEKKTEEPKVCEDSPLEPSHSKESETEVSFPVNVCQSEEVVPESVLSSSLVTDENKRKESTGDELTALPSSSKVEAGPGELSIVIESQPEPSQPTNITQSEEVLVKHTSPPSSSLPMEENKTDS